MPVELNVGDRVNVRVHTRNGMINLPAIIQELGPEMNQVLVMLPNGLTARRALTSITKPKPLRSTALSNEFVTGFDGPVPWRITVVSPTHYVIEWSDGHQDQHELRYLSMYNVPWPFSQVTHKRP